MAYNIDVVIPMVFPEDDKWQIEYQEAAKREHQEWSTCRYRSFGLEQLQIDLIKTHMPWVHKIYILLAQETQYQDWMCLEDVEVVFHKEFIPYPYCPAFSAYTIEMFLHNIKGLAEHFIYFNDDMFPIHGMSRTDFFVGEGLYAKAIYNIHLQEYYGQSKNSYWDVLYNDWILASRHFKFNSLRAYIDYDHGPHPMIKSIIKKAASDYRQEIEESITTFRSRGNFSQHLWCHFCLFSRNDHELPTGRTSDEPRTLYVSNMASTEQLRMLLCGDYSVASYYDILCFNDNNPAPIDKEMRELLVEYLQSTSFHSFHSFHSFRSRTARTVVGEGGK